MSRWLERWKASLSNTQARLVLLLTVAVSLLIAGVGLTSYYASKSVLQREWSEPQHQRLDFGMAVIDRYIAEADKLAVQVALHANVYRFLTSEQQASYDNITGLYEFLDTLRTNAPYLESIYVYDIARESFVSTPHGFSSRKETFPDSAWVEVADRFGDRTTLVGKRIIPEGARYAGTERITLYRQIRIGGEFKGIVALTFKSDYLFDPMTADSISGPHSSQFLFDRDGTLLYASAGTGIDPAAVLAALQRNREEPYGDFDYEGRRLLLSHARSPLTEWDYVSVVPQDQLLAKSRTIRNVVLSVSFAALLVGGIAIFFIQSVAFQPVRRMRHLFSTLGKGTVRPDLTDLERAAGLLVHDHVRLSQLLRRTLPEAAAKFLHDAVAGDLNSPKTVMKRWNDYFSDWSDAPLTLAVVSIDRYGDWMRRFPEPDRVLLKYALANMASELFAAQWRTAYVDLGQDRTVLVIQPAADSAPSPKATLAEVVRVAKSMLHLAVSVGVSAPHADAGRLRTAYAEADRALGRRLYEGYGGVYAYRPPEDDRASGSAAFKERDAAEAALSVLAEAVEAGAGEEAIAVLQRMIDGIRRELPPPAEAVAQLESVREKLIRIARGRSFDAGEEAVRPGDYRTLHLDDIAADLEKSVRELAERFDGLTRSRDYIAVRTMIAYMEEHLGDNVGVQDIAAAAGISVSLASQLFKQEMNETIHDCFTRMRIERAARLLVETDDKIADIAAMVGYQHENSFIRVFRKFNNITPGKYRELMRNRES
jgi:AraC-like DNA-binding protein